MISLTRNANYIIHFPSGYESLQQVTNELAQTEVDETVHLFVFARCNSANSSLIYLLSSCVSVYPFVCLSM